MDTRRQQAVYSALDSQARAYRLASLRAAVERDRMIRPGAPPGQLPRGAVFVSPAMGGQQMYPPPYGSEMGFPDSGGYSRYPHAPPFDPFEGPNDMRMQDYLLARPLPPPGYEGRPSPPPPPPQPLPQQHDRAEEQQPGRSFSPIAGQEQNQESKREAEEEEEESQEIDEEVGSHTSHSLSSESSERKPEAEERGDVHPEEEPAGPDFEAEQEGVVGATVEEAEPATSAPSAATASPSKPPE